VVIIKHHYLLDEQDQRERIGTARRDAGVRHELVSYPGTEHAFFWPGTPPFG
jgi:carboxymethylenebutenolidase